MKKQRKQSKRYVLSVRIDETEWELLQKALQKNTIDVSTVLKRGLRDFLKVAG